MEDIEFSPEEKAAFHAAGAPDEGGEQLTFLQQNDVREKWMKHIRDRKGPVPSMKGMTITQARSLYRYWDVEDSIALSPSMPAVSKVTWVMLVLFLVLLVFLAWLARPIGFYILGVITAVTILNRLMGHVNDKEIRFNDIRDSIVSD